MSLEAQVTAARDDVARTRTQIARTVAELETRVTTPVKTVRDSLDVIQLVRDHPWAALGVAVAAGALVSGTGADVKAVETVKEQVIRAGHATVDAAREIPGHTRGAAQAAARGASSYLGGLAGTLLLAFINRLRESDSASAAPR